MIAITLADLAARLEGRILEDASAPTAGPLLEVMTDSRVPSEVPAIFFALVTDRADGHDHVAAAARTGAVVAVVDRFVEDAGLTQVVVDDVWSAIGRLGRRTVEAAGCRVVAITGSYGKTTVKDLSAAALSAGRTVAASRGSFNNELGVPLTMLSVGTKPANPRMSASKSV